MSDASRLKPAALGAVALAALAGAFLLATAAAVPAPGPANEEGDVLRQIKSDVFDQKWEAVLASCTRFISQFPRSPDLSRAYYYRGQALEHSRGREQEAIAAYTDYLTRFPHETGALREDALLSRMTLATSLYLKGDTQYVGVIMQGMDEKGYPGIFAAIQASKIDHRPARAKSLPILKNCACNEADAELKNECVLALLRIEPSSVGELPCRQARPGTPPPTGDQVRLIRVEVYDKVKKQVTVRVNMPVAFAELLLDSLSEDLRDEISQGMQRKGMDLQRLWDGLKKGGRQIIIEIDNDQQHVKVWVE